MKIEPSENKLKILVEPNKNLRKKSKIVLVDEIISNEFRVFLSDLYATMIAGDGVGIAGPQVGILKRVCFVSDSGKNPQVLINPEITWFSKESISLKEGCLSIPNVFGFVRRSKSIHAKAYDENGKIVKIKAKGWLSRVIQHEIDHLDGILFIDKADSLERKSENADNILRV